MHLKYGKQKTSRKRLLRRLTSLVDPKDMHRADECIPSETFINLVLGEFNYEN